MSEEHADQLAGDLNLIIHEACDRGRLENECDVIVGVSRRLLSYVCLYSSSEEDALSKFEETVNIMRQELSNLFPQVHMAVAAENAKH
jgi:hypothetical protein